MDPLAIDLRPTDDARERFSRTLRFNSSALILCHSPPIQWIIGASAVKSRFWNRNDLGGH